MTTKSKAAVKGSMAEQLEVVKVKITSGKTEPEAEKPVTTADKVAPVKKEKTLTELLAAEAPKGVKIVGDCASFMTSFGVTKPELRALVKRIVLGNKKYVKEFYFDAEKKLRMTYDGWLLASLSVLETAEPEKVLAHRISLFEAFKKMKEVCDAVAAEEAEQLPKAA